MNSRSASLSTSILSGAASLSSSLLSPAESWSCLAAAAPLKESSVVLSAQGSSSASASAASWSRGGELDKWVYETPLGLNKTASPTF